MLARRPLLSLIAVAPLAACGFEPLYGRINDRSLSDELAQVKIDLISNRSGQQLRNHLLDGFSPRGQPEKPLHTLSVLLFEPRPQDIGIARDDTVVRYAYTVSATFRLADPTGRVVLQGSSSSVSSYEVTNSEFATLMGRNNARDRGLEEIANDLKAQIAAYLRSRNRRT